MTKLNLWVSAGLAAILSVSAYAEDCADTSWSALASVECRGSFVGNSGTGTSVADELTYLGTLWPGFAPFTFAGKSDDIDHGPFMSNPTVSVTGNLAFDTPVSTPFVISLKASNQYSYYLFQPTSPLQFLTFMSTAGVALNKQGNPQNLSHASLFLSPVSEVPEPQTFLMMLVGLGVVVGVVRMRQASR